MDTYPHIEVMTQQNQCIVSQYVWKWTSVCIGAFADLVYVCSAPAVMHHGHLMESCEAAAASVLCQVVLHFLHFL